MTTWMIWKQRNQVQLNQATCNVDQIAQQSKEMLAEFQACQTISTTSLSERQTRSKQRWRAPSTNMAKNNFDGAIFSGENKSGISIVRHANTGQNFLTRLEKYLTQTQNFFFTQTQPDFFVGQPDPTQITYDPAR